MEELVCTSGRFSPGNNDINNTVSLHIILAHIVKTPVYYVWLKAFQMLVDCKNNFVVCGTSWDFFLLMKY